jgi:predicted DNA-binding ribbon-helix-helix protein
MDRDILDKRVPGRIPVRENQNAHSTLVNRNVTVAGHRTSLRLEPMMWASLESVCRREGVSLHEFVTGIDQTRQQSSLTAAIRVGLLIYFQNAATEDGHRHAGHGLPVTSFGA